MNDFQKLQQEVGLLKEELNRLTEAKNIEQVANLSDRIFIEKKPADDSNVTNTITISIGSGGGSDNADVLDFPDGFIRMIYNGKPYRLPLYDESRFI